MTNGTEIPRPSITASFLWGFSIFIFGATIYSIVGWRGWTQDLNDFLLVVVAFAAAINAIATGALIDINTMKRQKKGESHKEPLKPTNIDSWSPERKHIAKIFKTHLEKAIADLGAGYAITLQGRFDETPIQIEIEVTTSTGEIP